MNYMFDILLTEEDYLDFNIFHMSRSVYGRKLRRRLGWMVAVMFSVAAVISFWTEGFNAATVIYALLLAALGLLLVGRHGKFVDFTTRRTIRSMKKDGKLPYSPESRMEFSDEGIVEITPEGRMEKRWESIERLCIREGKAWYLYMNNTAAFMLPEEQLRAQTDLAGFRKFLESKVPQVDVFDK